MLSLKVSISLLLRKFELPCELHSQNSLEQGFQNLSEDLDYYNKSPICLIYSFLILSSPYPPPFLSLQDILHDLLKWMSGSCLLKISPMITLGIKAKGLAMTYQIPTDLSTHLYSFIKRCNLYPLLNIPSFGSSNAQNSFQL